MTSLRASLAALLGRGLLILLGASMTLVCCELFLATFVPQLSPLTSGGFLRSDSRLGWALMPGARIGGPFEIAINQLGMRDREIADKGPNDFRVLMIGDSFTFGAVRAEDTFVKQLERSLRAQITQANVEVLNGGVPGYGPVQELDALRDWLPAVKPDLVVLGLFIGNDLIELIPGPARGQVVVDGALLPERAAKSLEPPSKLRMLVARTHLYQLLRRWREGAEASPKEDARLELDRKQHLWHESARMQIYYDAPSNSDWWRGQMARMCTILESFRTLAEDHRIPLLVALFPDEVQVNPALVDDVAALFPKVAGVHLDFDRPPRELLSCLRERSIPAIDLVAAFREAAKTKRLYLERDTHWNAEGNGLAAVELERAVLPMIQAQLSRR